MYSPLNALNSNPYLETPWEHLRKILQQLSEHGDVRGDLSYYSIKKLYKQYKITIYYEGRGFTTILKNIKSKPLTDFYL